MSKFLTRKENPLSKHFLCKTFPSRQQSFNLLSNNTIIFQFSEDSLQDVPCLLAPQADARRLSPCLIPSYLPFIDLLPQFSQSVMLPSAPPKYRLAPTPSPLPPPPRRLRRRRRRPRVFESNSMQPHS